MSTDIFVSLGVGFVMAFDDVVDPFLNGITEEVSHEEKRFDPKTGECIGTVKVVDIEPGIRLALLPNSSKKWGIDVKTFDKIDFFSELGTLLGCNVIMFCEGELVGFDVCKSSDTVADTSYYASDEVSIGSSLSLQKVMRMEARAKKLLLKMKKLGLRPRSSKPVIFEVCDISY